MDRINSEAKLKEFEVLAKPLIKFINDNFHPHTTVIVTLDSAEVLFGEMAVQTEEFILD